MDFTAEIPAKVQAQTYLTAPTLSPEELPPAGQQFYEDYEAEYGEPQDEIDPYAVYGYEAMAVVCDAIAEGGDDRAGRDRRVLRHARAVRARWARTTSITDGDTTLSDYGGYRAEGGKLVFNKVIKAHGQLGQRPLTRRRRAGRSPARRRPSETTTHGIRIHPRTTRSRPRRRSCASSSRSSA